MIGKLFCDLSLKGFQNHFWNTVSLNYALNIKLRQNLSGNENIR